MGCITKKLRGYGFFAMMLQLPIVAVQRTNFVRGRTLFNVRRVMRTIKDKPLISWFPEHLLLDQYDPWTFSRMSNPISVLPMVLKLTLY